MLAIDAIREEEDTRVHPITLSFARKDIEEWFRQGRFRVHLVTHLFIAAMVTVGALFMMWLLPELVPLLSWYMPSFMTKFLILWWLHRGDAKRMQWAETLLSGNLVVMTCCIGYADNFLMPDAPGGPALYHVRGIMWATFTSVDGLGTRAPCTTAALK